MSTRKYKGPSAKQLNKIMQLPGVRAQLDARARRVLPRTRALALQTGAVEFARELRIEHGTRPGTQAAGGLQRPYARITATMSAEQRKSDGRTPLTRRQLLRKGAFGA